MYFDSLFERSNKSPDKIVLPEVLFQDRYIVFFSDYLGVDLCQDLDVIDVVEVSRSLETLVYHGDDYVEVSFWELSELEVLFNAAAKQYCIMRRYKRGE